MTPLALPSPPEAYWNNVPWWGFFGFFIAALMIVVVIGPWVVRRAQGAPSAYQSRETALAHREERLLRDKDARIAELEVDVERGWGCGRGMELVAHEIHHEWIKAYARADSAVKLLQRFAEGKTTSEAAMVAIGTWEELPRVRKPPKLVDVVPVQPEATKRYH